MSEFSLEKNILLVISYDEQLSTSSYAHMAHRDMNCYYCRVFQLVLSAIDAMSSCWSESPVSTDNESETEEDPWIGNEQ